MSTPFGFYSSALEPDLKLTGGLLGSASDNLNNNNTYTEDPFDQTPECKSWLQIIDWGTFICYIIIIIYTTCTFEFLSYLSER